MSKIEKPIFKCISKQLESGKLEGLVPLVYKYKKATSHLGITPYGEIQNTETNEIYAPIILNGQFFINFREYTIDIQKAMLYTFGYSVLYNYQMLWYKQACSRHTTGKYLGLLPGLTPLKWYDSKMNLWESDTIGITPEAILQNMRTGKIYSWTIPKGFRIGVLVHIDKNGKPADLHRVYASTFIPNTNPELQRWVAILNKDITDIRKDNLVWTEKKVFKIFELKDKDFKEYRTPVYNFQNGPRLFKDYIVSKDGDVLNKYTGNRMKITEGKVVLYFNNNPYTISLNKILLGTFPEDYEKIVIIDDVHYLVERNK